MWDAYNHESIRWSELATTLLRALTTLAVALYLLGHAHAVGRSRAGRALAFAGGGLLVWASVSAGDAEWRNWNPAVVEVSDTCNSGLGFASADAPAEVRAARYYASARALLTTAETADQYRAARNALECMSQLRRGETTLPRADFVRAVEMESTSQTGQLWAGLPLKDDLPRITQRMAGVVRQYRSAGETPPSRILASLGRYSWLQAMEERGEDRRSIGDKDDSRRKLLGESVDLLTEAAGAIAATGEGREAQRRRILMSLAIAQYAAGLAQQADATANAALTIPGTGSRRVAGRALTDLELLRNHCRNVRDADYCASLATRIDSLKGRIVATTWQDANMLPVRRSDEVGPAKEMRIEVAADGLQWTLPPLRVTPQQQLALIWYEHDPRWNVWRAMPDVSGPIASSAPAALSYPAASRFERCISGDADVRYRAELYLDGRLVASGIGAPASGQRFKAWVFSDLNIAFCAPAGWSEIDVPQHAEDREMLVRAMGTDAASPTMVLFAFYGFNGTDAVPLQQIDRITEYLVRRGWIAAQTTLARREQSGSCANATKTDLPAYVSRTTNERLRHVAIALRDAEQPDACVALRSVTTRSEPPGIAKALTRPALASR